MICDWCGLEADKLYRTEDAEHVCRTCWGDILYCRMGGRIPQEPETPRPAERGSDGP